MDVLRRLQKHLILMIIAGSYGGQPSPHLGEPQPLSVCWQGTLSVGLQGIRIDNDYSNVPQDNQIDSVRLLGDNINHEYAGCNMLATRYLLRVEA